MKMNLLMVTLFLCVYAKYVSSIKCYDCSEKTNSDCKNTSYAGRTSECSDSVCIVMHTPLIIRSCGLEKIHNKGIEFSIDKGDGSRIAMIKYGGPLMWRTCDTDLCNGGEQEYNSDYNKKLRDHENWRQRLLNPVTMKPWEIYPLKRNKEVVYKSNVMLTLFLVLFIFISRHGFDQYFA